MEPQEPQQPIARVPRLETPRVQAALDPNQRALQAVQELRVKLASSSLIPPLSVLREGAQLVVVGTVNAEERQRALEAISSVRQRLMMPVDIRLTSDPDPLLFVRSVALAPEAYLVGNDGRRYTLRQRLPDGGILESIDETTITIDRDGIKERILYVR